MQASPQITRLFVSPFGGSFVRGKSPTQETAEKEPDAPAEGFALNGEIAPPAAPGAEPATEKPKARRMVLSPELQAIQDIQDILGNLSPSAQERVWRYVSEGREE